MIDRDPDANRRIPGETRGRTTEQEVASGRVEWTPVAVLTSVVGVIGLLFVAVLALVVTAYLLA